MSIFPDYNWVPAKFGRSELSDKKNHRKFMDDLAKELCLKDLSGWYNITYQVTIIIF